MAPTALQSLDQYLEGLFSQWNNTSTILAVVLVFVLFAPLFFSSEPDVHPFLLARQATASAVRQPGESAVYRSLETPHGYPLRSGLSVKDENAPRWAPGRDGDLRDVWREASKKSEQTKLVKVQGRLDPVIYEVSALNSHINAVGSKLRNIGAKRVAICLPNSVEFLVSLFAAAFYNLTPIFIPPGQDARELRAMLNATRADVVVAAAGMVVPEELLREEQLNHVILVVEESSRQMDWDGSKGTSIWHDIVRDAKDETLPVSAPDAEAPGIVHIWTGGKEYEIMEHSQKNIVAAIASQLSCLPRQYRLEKNDTVLSLSPLTSSYPLIITCAALYVHATVALLSSAQLNPSYAQAFQQPHVRPSIVIASPQTISAYLVEAAGSSTALSRLRDMSRASRLARGTMSFANKLPSEAGVGPRLLYIPAPIALSLHNEADPPLTPRDLHALRIASGARPVHALTAPAVAGALAQSHPLDYRVDGAVNRAHFGAPLSCVELKVARENGGATGSSLETSTGWVGRLVVKGPAVATHGKLEEERGVDVGVKGRLGRDGTIGLV